MKLYLRCVGHIGSVMSYKYVEIKYFIKRVLKIVIRRAFGELKNIFQVEFNKFYQNSQKISDSFLSLN